jgi:hypothetical protein
MARPRHDRAATETYAVTAPGFRRARKPLALSPCRQPAVRTAGQRSIRVTGLGEAFQQRVVSTCLLPPGRLAPQ